MFWCATIICASFSTAVETPPKHAFWTLQQYFLVPTISFFLICWNRKKPLGCNLGLHGGCPIDSMAGQKAMFWNDMWEHWFVFSCSFFEFLRRLWAIKSWCTTQNWPSCDAQVEQSPHDQFERRNRRPPISKYFFEEHNFH